jgi:hypothetical protein
MWIQHDDICMLWTCYGSKDFKISKNGLITFITSYHIFLCKMKISTSNGSKVSSLLENHTIATSMSIMSVIVVVKAFDNNQWPLYWFTMHTYIYKVQVKCNGLYNSLHLGVLNILSYKMTISYLQIMTFLNPKVLPNIMILLTI